MVKESATIGIALVLFLVGLAVIALIRPVNFEFMPLVTSSSLALTSSAFEHDGTIPALYTCDGDRSLSPPLAMHGVPDDAASLVLVMDDPDVPKALHPDGIFDHWVLFNIPPPPAGGTSEIPEGGLPAGIGVPGANGKGENAYTGPCPPPEYEPKEHRYVFKLYALSVPLTLAEGATKQEVLEALAPHVIGEAELVGRYSREQNS